MTVLVTIGRNYLQNKVLSSFYFDGLSYAEIARKTNRKVSVLRGQIERGKRKIREFYSDREGEVIKNKMFKN